MMVFDDSKLKAYAEDAKKQFSIEKQMLSGNQNNNRSDIKTFRLSIISLVGTVLWLAAFIAGALCVNGMVDSRILLLTIIIAGLLILFMLIDVQMDLSYFGKMASYEKTISYSLEKINKSINLIEANTISFMASKEKGWAFPLKVAKSIPEEVNSIKSIIENIERQKNETISQCKTILFFGTVVGVTVVGCLALFPVVSTNLTKLAGEPIPSEILMLINIVALIVSLIGEIILAKLAWSKTGNNVTYLTLFILPVGPLGFIALIIAVMLLVVLVMAILVWVILPIAVVGLLCCLLSSSGRNR